MRTVIGVLGVATLAALGPVSAQAPTGTQTATTPGKHIMLSTAELKWGPGPAALPAGVEVAVLDGDPAMAGMFTLRAKMPDGYTVPSHSHPTDEHLTVISGTMLAGMGDKFDEAAMHAMTPGTYSKMPARANHFIRAQGEVILQVNAMGPFDVTYVNPADDPRNKTTSKK